MSHLLLATARRSTRPGPRWSSYIHKLRHRHGRDVQTITKQHASKFAGHHARTPAPLAAILARNGVGAVSRDRFDWGSDDVVLRAYGSIALHKNSYGDVMIRQEADVLEDDDQVVVVPVQDAELVAQAIIEKAREIKAAAKAEHGDPPAEPKQLALPAPAPNGKHPAPSPKPGELQLEQGTRAIRSNGARHD